MERFSQQTVSDLAGNYARNRFRDEIAEAVPETMKCEACSKSFDLHELHAVQDGEYCWFYCTLCTAEFYREPECNCWLSGDQADASDCEAHGETRRYLDAVMEGAGVTRREGEAFLTWIDRKPVKVQRMQGELFPEEVA